MIRTRSTTVLLLSASNLFMTFAWYAHLKTLNHKPWIIAALVSWASRSSSTCCKCRRTASATPSSAWVSSR